MFRRKMLVFACAIAIFGIGACFLPPERIPPPPLPPYLQHVRNFSIQVQDASGQDLIDEGAMSLDTALRFNELWKDYSLRAKPIRASSSGDAVLRIVIRHKSAAGSATGKHTWTFALNSSLILTAADGRLLWQRREENLEFSLLLNDGLPSDSWNSKLVRQQASYSLAMSSGEVLFDLPFRNSSEKHP